ncbi:MAG: hypothetical protein M3O32_00780, partial [Actinomycetota bacterium]|nr:hypothetical protein [Actinomycetota bacterium]
MTSDDLLSAAALGLARAARDYACEYGPIASAMGPWLVLMALGAPAWVAGSTCVLVLAVTARSLWSSSRLAAAASRRQSRW